jgi:enterochelin esterase-like enzyme
MMLSHLHLFILCTVALLLLSACGESTIKSTATDNVQVLPYQFVLGQLQRQRTVRLYLPPSYQTSNKSYPVIYMHDGQNLFDQTTALNAEWQIDE